MMQRMRKTVHCYEYNRIQFGRLLPDYWETKPIESTVAY